MSDNKTSKIQPIQPLLGFSLIYLYRTTKDIQAIGPVIEVEKS